MSTNGDAEPPRNQSQTAKPALNVPFSTIADQHGEASNSRHNSRVASKSPRRSTSHHRKPLVNGTSTDAPDQQKDSPKRHKHRHHEKGDNNADTPQSKKQRHGFLLNPLRSSGRSKDSSPPSEKSYGKQRQHDVETTPEKRRSAGYSRQSNDASSLGSSPLSREVRSDGSWGGQTQAEQLSSVSPAMNPAQLVQMALSLSESRKRHVSNSLRIPIPANGPERRVVSAASNLGTVRGRAAERRHAPSHGNGGRVSTSSRGDGSARLSHDLPDPYMEEDFEVDDSAEVFPFSPSTLSRAEKARRYFELASEYRRMLQCLPPLKSDTSPVGHHRSRSLRASISRRPDIIDDTGSHTNGTSSGRQYNPLQALRNRDVRQRERTPLAVSIDNWQDIDAVKSYINSVEEESESALATAPADHGNLPIFPGDSSEKQASSESGAGRPRGSTTNSVITRPENKWFIEPAELLADAYWTERNGNKHLIENRRSQRIFPKLHQSRQSMDIPRSSQDLLRHSNDLSQINDEASDPQNSDNEVSAANSKKSRRHKIRLSIHGIDHIRKKRLTRMRAASDSSVSSVDSQQLRNLRHGGDFTNIGPLEKHMAQMIEQDERGHLSSPDLVSPDHWDSRNTQFPVMRNRADSANKRASTSHQQLQNNDSLTPQMEHLGHRRSRSADGRLHGSLNAPSFADYDSSVEPNSPVVQSHVPSFGMDLSSPAKKRDNKRISKLKKHFRSDSKERNHVDHVDFAEVPGGAQSKDNESDHTNGTHTPPRFSFDALRPLPVQRQKTSDSLTSSLRPTTTRESSSTVGRMFKNARLPGLVRTESRFRYKDKFGDVGSATDLGTVSDVERTSSGEGRDFRRRSGSTASDDMSPRHSFEGENRPKLYNQNMPTFVSAVRGGGRDAKNSPTRSAGNSQQHSRTHSQLRSEEKPDRPRIVLPDDVNRSQASLVTSTRGGKPYTNSTARSSRVSLDGVGNIDRMRGKGGKLDNHRNWSISHQDIRPHDGKSHDRHLSRISTRDVVRCRALILASGIKAREIKRLADSPRPQNDTSRSDLQLALSTTGTSPPETPVARKEESLMAGRILSSSLATTLQNLDNALRTFHSTTSPSLLSDMQELKHIASDQLTNTCHDASDEADAFAAQLATEFTMDVKNVEDSVEEMVRRRNRKFRVFRRIGFKGLEWTVLALMWAIWFVVVIFNAGRSVLISVVALIRWLLWF